jgi:hypothetical protein
MNSSLTPFWKRLFWLFLFGAAMAYLESAVVVYLRDLYYPGGFDFPLKTIPSSALWIEMGREVATIVMLVAVGFMFASTAPGRLAAICVVFGIWDIFYYIWLRIFIGWPGSLLNWDLLFLIPAPWIGPVIAPVLVSICLVVAGIIILFHESRGRKFHPPWWVWLVEIIAGLIIISAFLWNLPSVMLQISPPSFPWFIFLLGLIGGMVQFLLTLQHSKCFRTLELTGDNNENSP